jgi:hypothetical protein
MEKAGGSTFRLGCRSGKLFRARSLVKLEVKIMLKKIVVASSLLIISLGVLASTDTLIIKNKSDHDILVSTGYYDRGTSTGTTFSPNINNWSNIPTVKAHGQLDITVYKNEKYNMAEIKLQYKYKKGGIARVEYNGSYGHDLHSAFSQSVYFTDPAGNITTSSSKSTGIINYN